MYFGSSEFTFPFPILFQNHRKPNASRCQSDHEKQLPQSREETAELQWPGQGAAGNSVASDILSFDSQLDFDDK